MLEPHDLGFNPVHQNDAHSGKGIIVQLACRDSHDVAPIELLFFEWNTFFFH
jgi:hypothetical protein